MVRKVALVALTFLLAGCGEAATSTSGGVPVTDVVENVGYYYACGNEVLQLPDGRSFWPLLEQDRVNRTKYLDTPTDDNALAFTGSLTLAVAPPRPGDDIGTLTVYEDGMAKYVSHRGTTAWLDDEPVTYGWEC